MPSFQGLDCGDVCLWVGSGTRVGCLVGNHVTPTVTPRLNFQCSRTARALRLEVFLRDRFTCQACGYRPPADCIPEGYDGRDAIYEPTPFDQPQRVLHVDHTIPRSLGGPSVIENLQTMCFSCNSSKGAKTNWTGRKAA